MTARGLTRFRRIAAVGTVLAGLVGCDLLQPVDPVLTPRARPADLGEAAEPSLAKPTADSLALRAYYQRVLSDGLTQGLLRTDGGGPDTPFTTDMLVRNFQDIAFFSEYERGSQPLRRWTAPVRIETRFGASVDPAIRTRDDNATAGYARRLSRITGHPISKVSSGGNFTVFFAGEDDRADILSQIQTLEPNIDASSLSTIRNLPRETYCLVVAFTPPNAPGTYTRAVALIRTEQPDLMRLSCIHEELAQGLGLANDSPYARPSIFNDDDEFALLTSHDEKLLAILYDDRLRPGIGIDAALPVVRILAREVMGAAL